MMNMSTFQCAIGITFTSHFAFYTAGIYLIKISNGNTSKRCEICSKLTIKTPERRHWCCSGVFIVNFEHISHLVLVFLSIVNFEYVIAGWVVSIIHQS